MFFEKAKAISIDIIKNKIPQFFKNNFEISSSKTSKTVGMVICFLTLLISVLDVNAFVSEDFSEKWILLAVALLAPFILGLSAAYTITIKNSLFNRIWHLVFMFLMPILVMTMTEALNDVYVYNMTHLGFLGNYLLIIICQFIVFALTGNIGLSYLIFTPVFFGLGAAHNYIMAFRGTPFVPMDFLSINTAAGVASTYDFTPSASLVLANFLFILIMIIGIKTKTPKYHLITKIISRTITGAFSFVLLFIFYFTSIFADLGVTPDFWNQTRGYRNYGFAFNFFCNTKYMYMNVPNNYDPNRVEDYVNSVVDTSSDKDENKPEDNYRKPNIICIMNESFSDLGSIGNLTTNEDYMPFIRSLTENTVKGNLYVPVIGAGTSNTEFEFLTGHTTAFLPSGSNAYMLYIKSALSSIVSTLEAQKYSSYAFHPYYKAGWNRVSVYDNFGFNRFNALEEVMNIELMRDFQASGKGPDYLQELIEQNYPGKNMLVRQYISDSYDYKLLIEDFENRDKNVPYFAFNVTMQNHGGYTSSSVNFEESIWATSTTKDYIKANKYLSLVKYSDNAFKELIEYFKTVKEPTVICMFGDHQPTVETEFIAEVMGLPNLTSLTPEQEQERHKTPFIIWANYDIEEKQIDKLSSNYLSSLVLQTAGVKLTDYNKYLLKLSETLPVIDTVGYIDSENNYYRWSDVSIHSDLIKEYERIQYNSIFDRENINKDLFFIDGYEHKSQTEIEAEATSSVETPND